MTMLGLIDPQPTGLPALAAIALGLALFLISLAFAQRRRESDAGEARASTSHSSWIGIGIQGLGFMAVGIGPIRILRDLWSPYALGEGAVVLALTAITLALFVTASRAMGRNWSLVARTREDHDLVTWGPFALVRHPIYTALFAWLVAMAIGFGHWHGLILGVPLYWIGTMIRVVREERLLRAQFGGAYDAYAARVKRFVPGLI